MNLKLIDVLTLISVLEFLVILFFIFRDRSEVKDIKKDVKAIRSKQGKIIQRVSLLETSSVRTISVLSLTVDDVECGKQQMAQVQRYIYQLQPYMNSALEISNLISCVEHDVSPAELLKKVKASLEWEKEVERLNKKPESEYYQGD